MTYKELIKEFENYKKEVNVAFFERGEGNGTNHDKDRRYLRAVKIRDAAFSALLDIYNLHSSGDEITIEKKQKWLDDFNNDLDCKKVLLEKRNDIDELEKSEKIEDITDLKNVYSKSFRDILNLGQYDFSKMMNYAKRKMSKLNKVYIKVKKDEDIKVVDELTNTIGTNYFLYNKEKTKRENTVHHVGTPRYVIEAYKALITKEQIIYDLLINAIKNALKNADNGVSVEECILSSFENLDTYPTDRSFYADDEAFDLGQNTFALYDKTYKDVFLLSRKAKNKLGKNLSGYLN